MNPSSRRLLAVVVGVGLVVAPTLSGTGVDAGGADASALPAAAAAFSDARAASDAPAASAAPSAAARRSYVVNVGTGDPIAPGRVRIVRSGIGRAGGTVVQEWPQIGVFVVHSTRADFAAHLKPSAATRVTGVGPTRTVPVTETLRAVRRPAGGARAAAAPASRTAAEPREREQWGLKAVRADASRGRPPAAAVAPAALARVTVAVVDSGIEADHPDLRGRIDAAASLDCSNGGRPDATAMRWRNTASGHGTLSLIHI